MAAGGDTALPAAWYRQSADFSLTKRQVDESWVIKDVPCVAPQSGR